jgi:hypothetical protein
MNVKNAVLLIIMMTIGFAGSVQADLGGLVFSFSDTGSGTTLLTASGTADITGGLAGTIPESYSIGWDNLGGSGNDSTSLVADSDFFSFNEPNVSGVFNSYGITQGSTPLNVNGVNLESLDLDGTGATLPYFVLWFESALPQTGIVSATGSAVLNFDFANLPYTVGDSIDLQANGDVTFEFVAIPEPASIGLIGLVSGGIYFSRRFFMI